MTAKEYLSQAFRLDQRINSKLEQAASLRELAIKATASIHAERISGTKERSPMENAIVKLVDLEHEIDADIDRLVDLKRELMFFISDIGEPSYRLLLELRYLEGRNWEEIAKIMGCNLRWIYRLHGKALQYGNEKLINKE